MAERSAFRRSTVAASVWAITIGLGACRSSVVESPAPTSAVPTNAVPTSAVPTSAASTSAVPTSAVPTGDQVTAIDRSPATASVVEVIDGDTIDVMIDGHVERVRLIGIDTPEREDCLFDEATNALAGIVGRGDVELVADSTDRDRFGRLLRYVWVDDRFVNEAQVAAGLAVARRYPPDLAEAERLEAAEVAAKTALLGRWAPDRCGPLSTDVAGAPVDLRIDHVEYDAPGNDAIELNGEWVRIVNDGTSAVDLDGWQLRDASSTHRYRFPAIALAPGAELLVHSGCGQDTAVELYWCSTSSAIWNNDGDTAYLVDPSGNVAQFLTY